MDFFDTQILFYKFNDNKNSLDKENEDVIKKCDINGSKISTVFSLEIMTDIDRD